VLAIAAGDMHVTPHLPVVEGQSQFVVSNDCYVPCSLDDARRDGGIANADRSQHDQRRGRRDKRTALRSMSPPHPRAIAG
jgi:hypothetical protein